MPHFFAVDDRRDPLVHKGVDLPGGAHSSLINQGLQIPGFPFHGFRSPFASVSQLAFMLLKSLAADIVLDPAGVLLGCFRIFPLVTSLQNANPVLAMSNRRLLEMPIAQMSIIGSLYDGQARLVRHR